MAGRSKTTKRPRSKPPEPDINVTPLVDVVLVLLIIFMVVTPSLAQGETIELPNVDQVDRAPKDLNPTTLILAANGRMLLDKKAVSPEELPERLRAIHQVDPNRQVLLNTDAKVAYGQVRATVATLYEIGFRGVSLKVAPKKPTED